MSLVIKNFYSVFFAVFIAHVAVAWWQIALFHPPCRTEKAKKIVVSTVSLSPVKKGSASSGAAVPAVKKTSAAVASSPATRPREQKEAKGKREESIRFAKEKLASLSSEHAAELQEMKMLQPSHAAFDITDGASQQERGYRTLLVEALKNNLRLPEVGSVKIALTINRKGEILSCTTLAAKSEYNRKSVEAALKKIQLPPFHHFFEGEEAHTFTITFENGFHSHHRASEITEEL